MRYGLSVWTPPLAFDELLKTVADGSIVNFKQNTHTKNSEFCRYVECVFLGKDM